MLDILSVDNMRKSDAATISAGTSGRELMMRAARGVFAGVAWKPPVAIVCGSGNNAGDGYALALCLKEAGKECTVICVYDRFSDDGRYYFDKCREAAIPIVMWDDIASKACAATGADDGRNPLSGYNTVVDCLLGTGFKGDVRDDLKGVISAINESGAYVVSIDINSGLNGDTGCSKTCVRSDITVSVGGFKTGHFLNMAKDVMTEKVNVDIGIEPADPAYKLIEQSDIAGILGKRSNFSNKGTYGNIALIGGSTRYSGAIRLAYLANASMRSGAGVVKVALPSSIVHDVAPHILESTLFPLSDSALSGIGGGAGNGDFVAAYVPEEIDKLISNVKTVAFGMGIGTGEGAKKILDHLLVHFKGTLIVDADGLTLLSGIDRGRIKKSACNIVLTPHIKEFSRLTGSTIDEISEDPIGIAKKYAAETQTVMLLKGPSTIITDGERVYITDRGCAGMATAGSGDVLSGIAAAVCAYVDDKCLAASAAAYINGTAGELAEKKVGSVSMIASDTVAAIPEAIDPLWSYPDILDQTISQP